MITLQILTMLLLLKLIRLLEIVGTVVVIKVTANSIATEFSVRILTNIWKWYVRTLEANLFFSLVTLTTDIHFRSELRSDRIWVGLENLRTYLNRLDSSSFLLSFNRKACLFWLRRWRWLCLFISLQRRKLWSYISKAVLLCKWRFSKFLIFCLLFGLWNIWS